MPKSIIKQEIEKNISHRHIQGDIYYCEFCRVNSAIQKALKEAEKRIDELKFKIKTKIADDEDNFISKKDAKQILNDYFGVGKRN